MGRGGQQVQVTSSPSVSSTAEATQKRSTNQERDVEEKWLRIDGVEYNVTNFIKKHPGGSVIKFGLANTGADATDLFKAFHLRSARANKMLRALPQREPQLEVQPGQTPEEDSKEGTILRDFAKLEKELHAEGFFETSPLHATYRLLELVAIFALGLWCYAKGGAFFVTCGVLLHGLFGGRCGWVQHEAGHGSLVQSLWLGKRIQAACIGFGLGTTGSLWNAMHNKHHAATQKVSHDLDIDTTPLVAFYDTAVERSRFRTTIPRLWARLQAFTFLPITSGVFVMAFWLLYLHPREAFRKRLWEQAAYMVAGHVLRTAMIAHVTGWGLGAAYGLGYALPMWVSGMYLFGHFSLSHTHKDIVEPHMHKSWLRYALEHTTDISPGIFGVDWIMGYLNCQVLHHLWPQMPQYKQPEASRRLAVFCEKHGLEYDRMSYGEAWRATLGNLHTVGGHYARNGQNRDLKYD